MDRRTRSEIASLVAYQGDGERAAMDRYHLELEDIEELMLDEGFDRCSVCGWWEEAHGLTEDGGNGYRHPDC